MNTITAVLAISLVGAAPSFAVDASCKPVTEAMMKMVSTPAHLYSTRSAADLAGGKATTTETIYTSAGAIYVMINGKWRRSPLTVSALRDQEKENLQSFKGVCSHVRDELAQGEATALYHVHQTDSDQPQDSQVWISKTKGLPVREELDLDIGGKAGKSHTTTRFEYTNVAAPAGVQ